MARGDVVRDVGPGFSRIDGHKQQWIEAVGTMAINRDIRSVGVMVRCFDLRDVASIDDLGGDVLPVLPVIGRDVDETIIGSCPDHALVDGRLGQGNQCSIGFRIGADRDDPLQNFRGEIIADAPPFLAPIGKLEDVIPPKINRRRIVR